MTDMLVSIILVLLSLFQARPPLIPSQQFIVEIENGRSQPVYRELDKYFNQYDLSPISNSNYWRLRLFQSEEADIVLNTLKEKDLIVRWQYDRPVIQRKTPNDPFFGQQWDMTRIDMPAAWDVTTGGLTTNGDTIVVAILDVGFDIGHEDLASNIWVNRFEIPNDGIDNDQNDYIDDYYGLNVRLDNDMHPEDSHGTEVAGIIGARGNNSKGIAGVNWNIKMLLISGIQNESDIIEGYIYCKALRDKYRSSNGQEGAFIVATNLSAGIDNGRPEDHQLWCDQYESLGNSGILGVCATSNTNSDVDVNGDMPTTCPSEYVIAVTNTGMNDQKLQFAGYGKVNVDLGAPGTPSLSTDIFNGYENFDGTSAAAPHVAGAVGLLYSVACSDLLENASTDPGLLALQMKNFILMNTDQFAGLADITASGGRLNVAKSIAALLDACGFTGGPLAINSISPNPVLDETTITFTIPDLNPFEVHVYDAAGRLLLKEKPLFTLPGVQAYTLQVQNFVPGVYFVSILHRDEFVTGSILVQ